MQTHIKTLAWLYIILGLVGIMIAGIVVIAVFGGGLISGDQVAIRVTGVVAFTIGAVIVLVNIPGIIAGFGLLRMQPWARILTLALGILNLPGIPIGTALGIYTIWVLLDDESQQLFQSVENE